MTIGSLVQIQVKKKKKVTIETQYDKPLLRNLGWVFITLDEKYDCLSLGEQTSKMWDIHIMGCYSSIKRSIVRRQN